MRLFLLSLTPPPGYKQDIHQKSPHYSCLFYSESHISSPMFILTKKPAQNGQDCLTRVDRVKAMLVKEKARTMAPRPRWHKPKYRSSRAPPGPRPDMPLRLSDQPRDPVAEATLLESEGEGMFVLYSWDCDCVGGRWVRFQASLEFMQQVVWVAAQQSRGER